MKSARIWIMSDLHLEKRRHGEADFMPQTLYQHDVVVLAGDTLSDPVKSIEWADKAFTMPVVMNAGNHEFWGTPGNAGMNARISMGRGKAATTKGHVAFLEDEACIISSVRFLGMTLWTDFQLGGENVAWGMRDAERGSPDYVHIHGLSPEMILDRHRQSRNWLERQLSTQFDGPTVVVSHHAPSARSIAPHYRNNPTSVAYASDLDGLIEQYQPDLWIHGHVHDNFDYMIGRTRVICNPRGLEGEGRDFRKDMVVEVG